MFDDAMDEAGKIGRWREREQEREVGATTNARSAASCEATEAGQW